MTTPIVLAHSDRPGFAIVCIVAGVFFLSTMDIAVKILVQGGIPATEIVALRSALIVPCLFAWFAVRRQLQVLMPTRPSAHLVRGLIGATAPVFVFTGIQSIPLTDAAAVFFSSIFLVAILSVVFLKERVGLWRWGSIVVGYLGVLIVINPGGGGQLTGYLLVLAGAASYAVLFVSSRVLSRTETVASLVFSFHCIAGLVCMVSLLWLWQTPTLIQLAWIVFVAVFALLGHLLMTTAHKFAEASLIAPFEYSGVIWSLAADLLIWKEVLGYSTYVGTAIIVISGSVIAWRERRWHSHC